MNPTNLKGQALSLGANGTTPGATVSAELRTKEVIARQLATMIGSKKRKETVLQILASIS
jgi:hypothetical protein